MMARPFPKGAATTAGRPSGNAATTRLALPKTSNDLLEEQAVELVAGLEQREGLVGRLDLDDARLGERRQLDLAAAEDLVEPAAGDDRARGALLVDPAAAGLGRGASRRRGRIRRGP